MKKWSKSALACLILSLIGCIGLFIFTALPCIVLGHLSLRILRAHPELKGNAQAKIGLVIGYLQVAWIVALLLHDIFAKYA